MKLTALLALTSLAVASCQSTNSPAPANGTSAPEKASPSVRNTSAEAPASAPKPVPATKPVKPYPLKTCLVTDEPLDEWDETQTTVYNGQEMKFCCKMCLKKFKANPDKYLSMLP